MVEMTDAGAVKGGDCAAVRSAEYGGVVEGWVCVDGEFTGREHVKVGVNGGVVECD